MSKYFPETIALAVVETFARLAYLAKITTLQDFGLVAEFEVLVTRIFLDGVVPDHITDLDTYADYDVVNKRIYFKSPKGDRVLTFAFEADVSMYEFATKMDLHDLLCELNYEEDVKQISHLPY